MSSGEVASGEHFLGSADRAEDLYIYNRVRILYVDPRTTVRSSLPFLPLFSPISLYFLF